MYRIAVITDIHGNIYALNAVLNDMKNKSVDFVYCLGDMIGIGPFVNEIFDALLDKDNLEMITGNHDEAILALLNNEPYSKRRLDVITHHEWIAERLSKENKAVLEKLPRIINPTINEQNLHLTHYPIKQSYYHKHISDDPFDYTGLPSQENFSVIDGLDDFSLICFGHDHDSTQLVYNEKMFYNPGSLGCYNQPYARYGIIDFDEQGFNVSQKHVPYDFDRYINKLKKSSIPRKEIILEMYE
ncbi:metallophosphoesterase family protein [Virgibacillus doumboii]|uniref:metallophosphoesterase family protein n=1 Tax=Virgibacillus doumboii TaxID=2697503 RepID=UPI0013DFE01C|nr:metallophosphoesterase family protein [Virgibacillus doumboii]